MAISPFFKAVTCACLAIALFAPLFSFSQGNATLAEQLNQKLSDISAALSSYRSQISALNKTNRNLAQDIDLLEKKNQALELEIQAGQLTVDELKSQAQALQVDIQVLQKQLNETKQRLARSIFEVYQMDNQSLIEVVFSGNKFSDFFNQLYYLGQLSRGIQADLVMLSSQKQELDNKQEQLGQRLAGQERLLVLKDLQQQEIQDNKAKKASLIASNVHTNSVLSQKSSALEEVARQLRSQLYILKGLGTSVNLVEAHKKAQIVAQKVGIDANFLMAILKVESDIGNNVGKGHWQKDMNPRDRDAFIAITQKLNLNPDNMPVSSAPSYGWGGAMGPAQFLPTTWLSYESKISLLTGHNPPNPWDLEDAFGAAALKLAATGATRQDEGGEREAALRYFAGGNWQEPAYAFYADRVLAVKDLIAQSS